MVKRVAAILLLGMAFLPPASAEEVGMDHPLVSRYAGSELTSHWQREYDEGVVPLGKLINNEQFEKQDNFEGKITAIVYKDPENRSTLEIMRNYKQALQSQGFKVVWECKDDACGIGNMDLIRGDHDAHLLIVPPVRTMTAKLTRNAKSSYVYLYFFRHKTKLFVFEPVGMETGMVTADSLAAEMAKTGKAVLHINFDTGKDVILPDSYPTIDQVVTLMRNHPGMRVSIEGHTDNVGGDTANRSLSEERSAAVRAALIERGITAKRMESKGFGESAPIADNGTEEGRARNRRVEIVNLTPDVLRDYKPKEPLHARSSTPSASPSGGSQSHVQRKLESKQDEVTDRVIDKTVDSVVDKVFDSFF